MYWHQGQFDPDEQRRVLAELRSLAELLRDSQVPSSIRLLQQALEDAEPTLALVDHRADVFRNVEAARSRALNARFHLSQSEGDAQELLKALENSIIPALERQLKEAEKLQPALPGLN